MKLMSRIFLVLSISTVIVSCKNEAKTSVENQTPSVVEKAEVPVKKTPKVLTEHDKKVIKSLLTKAMITKESKSFVSAMVTANLTQLLSDQDGPFTVFAPSNKVFANLSKEEKAHLFNAKNNDTLAIFINSVIVEGKYNVSDLKSAIKKNGGKLKLKSLSGSYLTVSKKGENIIIKDEKGKKAIIEKNDIEAANGVLHIIDALIAY